MVHKLQRLGSLFDGLSGRHCLVLCGVRKMALVLEQGLGELLVKLLTSPTVSPLAAQQVKQPETVSIASSTSVNSYHIYRLSQASSSPWNLLGDLKY